MSSHERGLLILETWQKIYSAAEERRPNIKYKDGKRIPIKLLLGKIHPIYVENYPSCEYFISIYLDKKGKGRISSAVTGIVFPFDAAV